MHSTDTPIYRVDASANGAVQVWDNFASTFVLLLQPPPALVVAATFRNLSRIDPRRADDFMYGYQLAVCHCAIAPPGMIPCDETEH